MLISGWTLKVVESVTTSTLFWGSTSFFEQPIKPWWAWPITVLIVILFLFIGMLLLCRILQNLITSRSTKPAELPQLLKSGINSRIVITLSSITLISASLWLAIRAIQILRFDFELVGFVIWYPVAFGLLVLGVLPIIRQMSPSTNR